MNVQEFLKSLYVYRPPRERVEIVEKFMVEFKTILDSFKNVQNVFIGGDYNEDLLSCADNSRLSDFVLDICSHDFYPKITRPTRISRFGAKLIDNFLCKCDKFESLQAGILTSRFSDHQPYFIALEVGKKLNTTKAMFTSTISLKSKQKFKNDVNQNIKSIQIEISSETNSDSSFNALHEVLINARNKNINTKQVLLDKRKHPANPWMTKDLIRVLKSVIQCIHF